MTSTRAHTTAAAKIRKKDTGEQGNRGEFGTVRRGDANVVIAPAAVVHSEESEGGSGLTTQIPTWAADRAEHKVELANRRLEREGIAERFVLERVDGPVEYRRPTPDEVDQGGYSPADCYAFQYSTITLNRPSISHGGWQFAAALDRVPGTDEFMMRTAPGHEFGGWRPEPGRCDHCGKFRDRNTTYLVKSPDTGETLQVGATCMEAFLGIRPKGLWTLGAGMDEFHDDEDLPVPSEFAVEDNRELIAKALVASDMGRRYVSKSRAQEWASASTADQVLFLFGTDTYRNYTAEERNERDEAQAKLHEVLSSGIVDEVIAAGRSVPTDSDYGQNLVTALDAGYATPSMSGTVISTVAVYGRQQREAEKEKLRQEHIASATPGFVAPEKTRLREIPVTVTNVYEGTRQRFAYPYGDEPFQIITMRNSDGLEIVWKTSAVQPVAAGDEVTMTGTVKAHTQFRGVDQTEVSRAKLERPVTLAEDGLPAAGAPFSPSAFGRAGKKLKRERVRIEAAQELPHAKGTWKVTARTATNHRISWETSSPAQAGEVSEVSGSISYIDDVGVKTAVIGLDD